MTRPLSLPRTAIPLAIFALSAVFLAGCRDSDNTGHVQSPAGSGVPDQSSSAGAAPSTSAASATPSAALTGPASVYAMGTPQVSLPPPGASKTDLKGCIAAANTEAEGAKYAPPPPTRAAPKPEVVITPANGGITVTHEMQHGCCLKGAVATDIQGTQVRVVETLSGNSCRCMCASTLSTAVGLNPGQYTVTVVRVNPDGNSKEVVSNQPVAVGGAPRVVPATVH
jgi:hypothetical protein